MSTVVDNELEQQSFLGEDFLLHTEASRRLYHEYAAAEPNLDYHCQLPPKDLADDRRFNNLFELWLEGDHYVVDKEQRLAVDRPWLTLAIDVASRMVAGFNVSLWAPSALSVSLTLAHAVLSKANWLADRERKEGTLSATHRRKASSSSTFCQPFRGKYKGTGFTFTTFATGTPFWARRPGA